MFTKGKHRRSRSIYSSGLGILTEKEVHLRALGEINTLDI